MKKELKQSEGKDSVEKEEDSPVSKMEIPVRELFLLHASVINLGFPLFAQRIIMEEGIENIKDLLRFIREDGMEGFCRFRQLGPVTVAKMEARLRELNLLDEKGDSYLYVYLDNRVLDNL